MSGDTPFDTDIKAARKRLLTGIGKAEERAGEAYNLAKSDLTTQYTKTTADLNTYFNQAVDMGKPWAQAGLEAMNRLSDSVSADQSKQNQSYQAYLNSGDYRLLYGKEGGAG